MFCWAYGSVSVGLCLKLPKDPKGDLWALMASGTLGTAAIMYFLGQMMMFAGAQ